MPTKRSTPSKKSSTAEGSAKKEKRAPRSRKQATAAPKTARRSKKAEATAPASDQRRTMIAVAAYYRAEARGFHPGGEMDDWLAAEKSIDEQLARA